jgi:hypothetical protein
LSDTKEDDNKVVGRSVQGRPKKKDLAAKKAGNRGKVGRPKGDAAIMNEYKARMLASPKSRKVLETILSAALDDEHKNQAAAWKIVVDRMLPVGMFEKDVLASGGKNSIQINITGVGGASVVGSTEADDGIIEGDYTDAEG